MTVRYLWLPTELTPSANALTNGLIEVTGAGYDPSSGTVPIPADSEAAWKAQVLLIGSALCSNAKISASEFSKSLARNWRSH
jgi:hypothetical protein